MTAILVAMSKTKKKLIVKRSSAGLGLFTQVPFIKGDKIIEYTGEIISEAEAVKRGGKYLFELNEDWTIDGKGRSNTARYINHSCRPNCEPQLTDDEKQVFIYAKKDIAPNEELTYNYGSYYFKQIIKPLGCNCKKCSKASTQ